MQLNPYLNFNGQCEVAFKFYEQCLDGKNLAMMTHGDSPMAEKTPAEWRDKILHARLEVGDGIVMGSDVPPAHYRPPQGIYVSLGIEETSDAERIFQALAENGKVQMPIQKTFWAERFGTVTDQFGISWMINCEGVGSKE